MSSVLYPKHGVLNRVEKPYAPPRVNTERFNSIETTKTLVRDFYTPNALANTGPYKGIVLRVEDNNLPQVGTWVDQAKMGKPLPKLIRIKVRIPELHSMLPIPKDLGPQSTEHAIIDMYPTFIAQNNSPELSTNPEIGSLVWVDFGNKTNFTDPIYLRPVFDTSPPGGVGNTSGVNAFNSPCAGNLSSNAPKGDELSGKNKPLSHAGLPLLPRKPASAMVGESISLKGKRFNQLIVSAWEKEIKTNGVPGRFWIGCLSSNGAEAEHKNGKRETIIYSANITDYSMPIELIYYFHGFKEFNNGYDFQKRYPQNIKSMASEGRNFVLVIPELSWSNDSIKQKTNLSNSNIWKQPDSFVNFDNEVRTVIKENFSTNMTIKYISIMGGNASLKSIIGAYNSGLDTIKPNRLVLTEFDESGYKNFIDKSVEINLIAKKGSDDEKRYNNSSLEIKNKVIMKSFSVDNKALWDMVIPFVSDENKKKDIPNQSSSALPAPKNADVSPSSKPKVTIDGKSQINNAIVKEAVPFEEARVSLANYGGLQGTENILVPVTLSTTNPPQLLHVLVNKRLMVMNDKWMSDHPGFKPIMISSGYRNNKVVYGWNSEADYELYLMKQVQSGKVKYKSVEEGKKYLAYNSPHESGLAFDIASNGLEAKSLTIDQQRKTPLYKWLVENAHKYGITPYKNEPWHWECSLPRESWASGEEFTNNLAVRVENPGQGGNMPMPGNMNRNCIATVGNSGGSSSLVNNGISMANAELDKIDQHLKELRPEFQQIVIEIFKNLQAKGWQPKISNAFRSKAEQLEKVRLGYAPSGATNPGTHNWGLAIDIIDKRYGWNIPKTNKGEIPPVAQFFKDLQVEIERFNLVWGGDMNSWGASHKSVWNQFGVGWDPAHVEFKKPPQEWRVAYNPTGKTDKMIG